MKHSGTTHDKSGAWIWMVIVIVAIASIVLAEMGVI